ncbi:MAG: TIGR00304 family membrane protein [Thermoproteota archaeon]
MLLILLGFGMAFVGILFSIVGSKKDRDRKVKAGGILLIGPIPIVLGSDQKWICAAIVLVLAFIFFILMGGFGL